MLDTARLRLRRRLCRTATDVTEAAAGAGALVLAPHPDDETLACGATILRKVAAGSPVTLLVVTDGRNSHPGTRLTPQELADLRATEMTEAARRLGLGAEGLRWGGLTDGTLAAHEADLVDLIGRYVAELRPQEVYVTGAFEPHADHAALGRAARRVAATTPVRLLEYPVWLWLRWPTPAAGGLSTLAEGARVLLGTRPTVTVRTDPYLSGKLHAIQAHGSQVRRPDALDPGDDWWTLPPHAHAVARDPVELFLPWQALR